MGKKKSGPPPAAKSEVAVRCAYGKMVDTNKIKPNPVNPNTHPDVQIDRLALLIKEHGWRHPITVSKRSGKVVSGHCRLLAARKLNLKQVPVDYQDFVSDAEEYAVLIADNVIQELAQIDGLKMADILCELDQANYDLALTALGPGEIEDYINGPLYDKTDAKDDEVPESPKKLISKPGDLWLLGDHRLLCGDSTKAEDIERVMNGKKAEMAFADPPYGVDYGGHANPRWSQKHQRMTNDSLSNDKLYEFWIAAFTAIAPIIVGDLYVAAPPGPPQQLLASALNQTAFEHHQWLIWVKDQLILGRSNYHYRHEHLWYGWRHGACSSYRAGRDQDSVWEFPRPKQSDEHPTMKPVELVCKAIGNSSQLESIVFDPFLGSGTTILASHKLKRKCYGMEIEPIYCDVIIKRWEQFTGQKAKLA